jgi:hypothetical protein
MVAAAAELRHRLYEQDLLHTGVMGGVTRQTTQMSLDVLQADLPFVAVPAARENHLWCYARITLDLAGIAARAHVIGPRSVAAFASAGRGVFTFEGLGVGRLRKTMVGVFMAALADFDADIFGRLRLRGGLGK